MYENQYKNMFAKQIRNKEYFDKLYNFNNYIKVSQYTTILLYT